MKLNSKTKYWVIVISGFLSIIIAFFCGYTFRPKLFTSSSDNPPNQFDYDVIGSGEQVLNRQWRELHLGMSKSEVESILDSISPFFDYKNSETFLNTQVLELADPDNGFQEYVPTFIYFYKDRVAMIKSFTDIPVTGRQKIVMDNLRTKYTNLDSLYYSNNDNSVGAMKRRQQGIHIPKFLPDLDNDRIYELRDGHTIINIFDAHNLGVCVLMYDRHSHYSEDIDSLRQNRL